MKPVRNVFSHFEHLGKQLRGLAVKLADQCCPREQKKKPPLFGTLYFKYITQSSRDNQT